MSNKYVTIKEFAPHLGAVVDLAITVDPDFPEMIKPTELSSQQMDVLKATIIGIDAGDKNKPYWLGWHESEPHLYGANPPRADGGALFERVTQVSNVKTFSRALWASATWLVVATRPVGMQCQGRHCGEFNPWAAPNMPDGRYLCFSCRARPAYLRDE
jgi:hypothetical protein